MPAASPTLRNNLFRPGQRIAIAVSGGADSVALLRCLLEERHKLGIVVSVVHVHHGIREAAEEDATFVAGLAAAHDLPFSLHRTDAPAAAAALHETLEEAARNLRYAFFRQLMKDGLVDAVATAHTLDDQAETVLHKLLRGAWTEGLSGIHPVLAVESGSILRPFLDNSHEALEGWLLSLPQPWREDASNRDLAHTRNRIRWQLLPLLRTFNPQIAGQLARLASISADEEDYWQRELQRLLPSLLLPGRPTRGAAARPVLIPSNKRWAWSGPDCATCIRLWLGEYCARPLETWGQGLGSSTQSSCWPWRAQRPPVAANSTWARVLRPNAACAKSD
jgi:tRNA(Ile)-lysidine synthase